MSKNIYNFIKIIFFTVLILTVGCSKFNSKMDPNRPTDAEGKRKQNIKEGKGASIGSILSNRGATNYEFSSSNPMWRATLETLDFLPLTTVDYSGGVIITDWYSDSSKSDAIKITIRFLTNEIRSDSLKIIVHKKVCDMNNVCTTKLLSDNLIKNELRASILKKASLIEKASKQKK